MNIARTCHDSHLPPSKDPVEKKQGANLRVVRKRGTADASYRKKSQKINEKVLSLHFIKKQIDMPKKIVNPPTPKILINSIRQIGYSFESAVADIIDNSISSNAKKIDIFFPVNQKEEPYIAFIDNGLGMSQDDILNALKIGSNFEGERNENDLGRFGLGLKSASFSQCRKLTVVSKKNNIVSAYGWDIDEVERSNQWNCYEYNEQEISTIKCIDKLNDLKQGSLVVWENFDLVEAKLDDKETLYRQLSNNIEQARNHISFVFHRFLNETGKKKTAISINNYQIEGLDPFLENHLKVEKGIVSEPILKTKKGKTAKIRIQSFILPHYTDLTENDRNLLGGAEKMRDSQGFYIYRNDRLIIFGTWFKLRGIKSELAKYAKIKVDIPNTLDDIWEIDIKKQKATIPQSLLEHFKKAVNNICRRSEKKTTHKAKLTTDKDNNRVWNKKVTRNNKEQYFINLDSTFIREYVNGNFEEENHSRILRLLEIISEAIPFEDIYNSVCNHNIDVQIEDEKQLMIVDEAIKMARTVSEINKISLQKAIEQISKIEPFSSETIIEKILSKIENE